jgi:hydroxyacylglutathione hydrolase
MRVAEGIVRVDGLLVSNAYLAETSDGLVLVDTGMPGSAARVVACVEEIGRALADVRIIVLTHADLDHMGSAAELKDLTGASVAVHAGDAAVLEGGPRPRKGKGGASRLFRLATGVVNARPVSPDMVLEDGDEIAGMRVIHTPGHTPGSIALLRGSVLFSGDTLLGDSEGNLRPPRPAMATDIDAATASAASLEALDWHLLLPGHGEPVAR